MKPRKRLSRNRLIGLFIASLTAGILLRLVLFPPMSALSETENRMIGNWQATDQDDAETLWQFSDDRVLVVSNANGNGTYSDAWQGTWHARDNQLAIQDVEQLSEDKPSIETSYALTLDDQHTMTLSTKDRTLKATKQ